MSWATPPSPIHDVVRIAKISLETGAYMPFLLFLTEAWGFMRKICALATRKFPSKEKKYVYNLYSRDTKEAGRKPGKKRGIFQLIELLQETLFLSCKLHTMPLACLYYQILIVETILYWILRWGWPRLQFGCYFLGLYRFFGGGVNRPII